MSVCKICGSAADKTGSHIVPHFLMKRIDSEEGKKGRDKELGFVISTDPSSYFGRGTSVEKLEQIFGEIDDNRIESNKIPLVEDYIFCSRCESELANLESKYADSIEKPTFNADSNYSSKVPSNNALLFWISIIYRLSISKNSGIKLKSDDEEILKGILNDFFLTGSITSEMKRIRYKIFRAYQYSSKHTTVLHFNPFNVNPYLLVVDEFVIVFAIDVQPSTTQFYDVNLPTQEAIQNSLKNDTEIIYCLNYDVLFQLNQAFFDIAAKQYKIDLFNDFDSIFEKFGFGKYMPLEMKEEIFKNLSSDKTTPFGDKYTQRHKAKVIYEVIKNNFNNA